MGIELIVIAGESVLLPLEKDSLENSEKELNNFITNTGKNNRLRTPEDLEKFREMTEAIIKKVEKIIEFHTP